jgi:hypothetical protein
VRRREFDKPRLRRKARPVTFPQQRYLRQLADLAGMEVPVVFTARDAHAAIERLRDLLTQPTLFEQGAPA